MKASDVSQLTHEELMDKYRKYKEELFHLRFQLATGQLEKTHRLQLLRRDLARVLTFLAKLPTPAPAPKAAKPVKAAKPAKAAKVTKPEKAAKTEKNDKTKKAAAAAR